MAGETATGLNTGRTYQESEIALDTSYEAMKGEPLVDGLDDAPVIPVNRKSKPHFRYLGQPTKIQGLHKKDPSPAHNKTVVALCNAMSGGRLVEIFTYNFDDDYNERLAEAKRTLEAARKKGNVADLPKYATADKEEQVLFSYNGRGRFVWFSEADARVRFDDWTWIQPDIAGRSTGAFMPSGRAPGVIIEVIRTHLPEAATFRKLMKLSRTGIHVFFFFVDENCSKKTYNQLHVKDNGVVRLRIAVCIMNGECVANGEVKTLKRTPPAGESSEPESSAASPDAALTPGVAPESGKNTEYNEDDDVWVASALEWLENIRRQHD